MSYVLDDIDKGILRLLQEDSRMSNKQLARRLHRTLSPIQVRVRRLQQEGFIKRNTVLLDRSKVGMRLIVYTHIKLKEHTQDSLLRFPAEAIKLHEVMECYHMSGDFDFLLRIVIKDMEEYNDLLKKKLSKLPDVATMESFFVLSEEKYETSYQLA
jgi:DNA-binding Lrp family transcriptional regulator